MKAAHFIQLGKRERIEISGNENVKLTVKGRQIIIENDEGTKIIDEQNYGEE